MFILNVGAVRSKVTHPENKRVSQSIRNPVTVCSVRGTEYICFASGRVICFEGAVAVFPAKLISPSFFANMSTDDVDDEVNYDSEMLQQTLMILLRLHQKMQL